MAGDGSVKIGVEFEDIKSKVSGLGNAMKSGMKVVATAVGAAGVAVKGLGIAAVKAGIEYESAFAGVLKTVDFDGAIISVNEMSDGLRDMAKNIPMSAVELAGIAEAAGQLGINTDKILGFTRVMADLGVATNLTGEAAATTFARFANITGMSQDSFSNLGSSIVALGNSMATTESEIADMALGLAAAGTGIGMAQADIIGLAAAMTSLNIGTQAGSTAVSKVMSQIQLAVETGSDKVADFAKVAGMTANEFATKFKGEPTEALLAFIEGLDKGDASVTKLLDDLNFNDVRMVDSLKRMAGSGTLLADAIKSSSSSWKDNTALTKEAETRYATMESKITMLKNRVVDLGIAVSGELNPAMVNTVDTASGMLDSLQSAFDEGGLQGLVSGIGSVLAEIVVNISDAAPIMVDIGAELILNLLKGITDNKDVLATSGAALAASLIIGIMEIAPQLLTTFTTYITAIIPAIGEALPGILNAGIDMVKALALGMLEGMPMVVDAIGQVIREGDILVQAIAIIGTALVAFKVGTAIANGVQVLTTAFSGLNAVMGASPVGLIAAAFGVALVAFAAWSKEANKVSDATRALAERSQELVDVYDEMEKRTKADKSAHEDLFQTINGNVAIGGALTAALQEQMNVQDKDVASKAKLLSIVDQLNSVFPDLNLAYDETTDSLNMTFDAMQDFMTISEKQAKNIALGDRNLQIQRDIEEATRKRTDASQQLLKTEQELIAAGAELLGSEMGVNTYNFENVAKGNDTLIDSFVELSTAVAGYNQYLGYTKVNGETATRITGLYNEKISENADEIGRNATEIESLNAKLADTGAFDKRNAAQDKNNDLARQGYEIQSKLDEKTAETTQGQEKWNQEMADSQKALGDLRNDQDAFSGSIGALGEEYGNLGVRIRETSEATGNYTQGLESGFSWMNDYNSAIAGQVEAESDLARTKEELLDIQSQLDAAQSSQNEKSAETALLIAELTGKEAALSTQMSERQAQLDESIVRRQAYIGLLMGSGAAIQENSELERVAAGQHAESVDELGNLLDANGKVVVSIEQLTAAFGYDAEAVGLFVDQNNDLIDAQGNLVASSELVNRSIDTQVRIIQAAEIARYEATKTGLEKAADMYEKYVDTASNAFEKVKVNSGVSVKSMLKNLTHNAEQQQKFTDGLKGLAEKGVNEGLIKELEAQGPAANKTIQNLLKAKPEDIDKINEQYATIATAAAESVQEAFEGTGLETAVSDLMTSLVAGIEKDTAIATALGNAFTDVPVDITLTPTVAITGGAEAVTTQVGDLVSTQEASTTVDIDVEPTVKLVGGSEGISKQIGTEIGKKTQETTTKVDVKADPNVTIEGGADGVSKQLESAFKGGVDAVDVVLDVNVTANINTEGLSTIGTTMTQAVTSGISGGQSGISTAMSTAISAAAGAANGAVKGFDAIGKFMCEGVASGIRSGQGSIIAAINAAAAAARAAFQSAMKIASPSKVMAEDGYYVAAGIAKGIVDGTPLATAAMEGLTGILGTVAEEGTEEATRRTVASIQSEIDAIEKVLTDYQKMIDDKKAAEELAEKQDAVKKAKNKKARIKAQEELNEHLKKLENERLKDQKEALQKEIDQYESYVNTLVKHYDFLSDQIIVALKNQYEQERDLLAEQLETQYNTSVAAADRLYEHQKSQSESYLAMIEDEMNAEVAALQGRIDAINAEIKAEKDAAREKADAEKIAELQAAVDRAKNAKFRTEAQKKLDEELERQAIAARDRARQDEIESLKNQISDTKDNYDEQKTLEEQRIDEVEENYKRQTEIIKENYEAQKKEYEQHFKELLSAERLSAEARRILLNDSNEEMIELLASYNPEWYNAGKSFGELFVEALDVQMDNVYDILERAAAFADRRLDDINRKIAEITAAGSAAAPPSISAQDVSNVTTGKNGLVSAPIIGGNHIINLEINQPVQSPAELQHIMNEMMREAAYAL
jgi:phage tail tape measure protein, TP901 family, core region